MRPIEGHWTGNELKKVKAELFCANTDLWNIKNVLFNKRQEMDKLKVECEERILHEQAVAAHNWDALDRFHKTEIAKLKAEIERLKILIGPMDTILTVHRRTCG